MKIIHYTGELPQYRGKVFFCSCQKEKLELRPSNSRGKPLTAQYAILEKGSSL